MSNTDTQTTDSKKQRVATHEWLDRDGSVVDAEEQAYGYRYTLEGVDEPFEYQYQEGSDAARMLCLFGAKTKSTNESSGVRNGKSKGGPDEQMAAVKEFFERLEKGEWSAPSEGGPAVRVDKDALTEAICRVLVASGKKSQADIDGGHKAKIRQKLEEDVKFVRTSRQIPQVADEYSKITGRATMSVDDLANID